MSLKKEVERFILSEDYKPMVLKEIYKRFKAKTREKRRKIREVVKKLEKEGKIFRDSKGRYRKLGEDLKVGTIEFTRSGYVAFVITDEFEEIAVPVEDTKYAMHKDRVVVEIVGTWRGLPRGRVVRVLERGLKRVVGVFDHKGTFGFVVPDDPKIAYDFYVAPENIDGAKPNQKVIAEILKYPSPGRNPEARVVKVLGDLDDPSIDLPSVIVKHDLPEPGEFPEEVLKEANAIPSRVRKKDLVGRKDMRDRVIVTIDGEDAKDFDDAISVEKLPNGNYLLGVHIADVSHYVKEGSALDQEAFRRGTSVYLIDTVIPMLPFRLSNGICSLVEGKDRLTMSVEMEIDREGRVVKYDVFPSVIRSKKRMIYERVNEFLENPSSVKEYEPFSELIHNAVELAEILREARRKRGAIIDIESDEVKVVLDENGQVVDIVPRKRGIAERLIEEFMIRANETIAEIFDHAGLPFMYRVHEEPDPETIFQLKNYLEAMGIRAKFSHNIHPGMLQKLLEKVKDHPLRSSVERLLVRSMKRAMYSAVNIGHFGLASYAYTHFTSPIRRYPDLVVHRLLKLYLEQNGYFTPEQIDKFSKVLPKIAKHCSRRERVADEAEWDLIAMKKVEYISRHIGEVFDVVVTNITKFGLFVEIPEKSISGLVHISTLDDYYYYDESKNMLIGRRKGRIFRLGDVLKAKVVRADKIRGEIDFELVEKEEKEG
ncbi:ribonuclease R [Thermotoga sp. RQ7]|uniref:ribonuclease R n=1 Tax=Thermotoga sp. RQ7 TaxID=126738 RepID=UPI0005A3694A|nr:ribonuclease R [Thermotoga sp. RQ7]AJG40060.1 ribonuclease R [Thermotoga sp. RQ7]